MARALQPSIVVLEDCDLIAEDRSFGHGPQPLLFEVLDAMDGLDSDADVAFVLTTNRVDMLERALAQRPGRVDLAVEIPLPAQAERTELVKLYARGIPFSPAAVQDAAADAPKAPRPRSPANSCAAPWWPQRWTACPSPTGTWARPSTGSWPTARPSPAASLAAAPVRPGARRRFRAPSPGGTVTGRGRLCTGAGRREIPWRGPRPSCRRRSGGLTRCSESPSPGSRYPVKPGRSTQISPAGGK